MHEARTHTAAPSGANYTQRLAALREALGIAGTDALLVTHLPNVFYLSGFTGTTAALLVTQSEQHFITDFRYHGRLGTEVHGPWQLADSSSAALTQVAGKLVASGQRLGIEAERMSVAQHAALVGHTRAEVVAISGVVEALRLIKDDYEQGCLRGAAAVGAAVFTELLPLLSGHATEADIAAEIEYRARKHGATAASFKPIVASGARSALPHAGFSQQRLQPGVPTVIDMGVVVDGYCSDMTRTVFLGDCPPPWRERYSLVQRAQAEAQAAYRPGIAAGAADAVARDIIAAAGYGVQFGHGLGHGVGIEIHEPPRLIPGSEAVLQPGMVVTCEPGVYLPGDGGIRIENLCAITASGCENLTPLDTELLVV